MNKLRDFEAILACGNHDCVCVTESWLNNSVGDGEVNFPGFNTYRLDRVSATKSRGGGILFVARDSILTLRRPEFECDEELFVIELRPQKRQKMAIILCYRPPDGNVDSFVHKLNLTLSAVAKDFNQVLLLGDFNLPDLKGCLLDYPPLDASLEEQLFMDTLNGFYLKQINTIPSRKNCDNILDFVCFTDADRISIM